MASLSEYAASRELLLHLTLRELRGKYRHSALGWAWSLAHPLATVAVFTLVFEVVFRIEAPLGTPSGLRNYPMFLLCGLLPWTFVVNGTTGAVGSLVGNANLVKKTYFPHELLVMAQTLSLLATLGIELVVLSAVLFLLGNVVVAYVPLLVVVTVALLALVSGLGMALAVANVYFRDVTHLLTIAFQFWFYLSPIVYPIDFVPVRAVVLGLDVPLRTLYSLNPMVSVVSVYRDALYHLRQPQAHDVAFVVAAGVVTLLAGRFVFNRYGGEIADEL